MSHRELVLADVARDSVAACGRNIAAFALLMACALANAAEPRIARHGDVTIEYYSQGKGERIVLLPSLGRGVDELEAFAVKLESNGLRVVRPQPRGIGGSKGPMTGISLHDFARDVASVIAADGGGASVIAGHAAGHFTAQVFARDYPQLTRAVVLLAAMKTTGRQDLSASVQKSSDGALPEDERLVHLRRVFFVDELQARSWLHGWHREAVTAQRSAARATPVEHRIWGGAFPILDIVGAEDPFAPPHLAYRLREQLGERVSVVVIPSARHALIPEQPDRVTAAVVDFMRRLSSEF